MDAERIAPVSALDVARYFLDRDSRRAEPDVTPMKLAKLLYFAQANSLADTGERLFNAEVEAYEHGPVVHEVWKHYPSGPRILASTVDEPFETSKPLPAPVEEFLDRVWARFGDMSASALRALTHRHAPWRDHYDPAAHRPVIPDAEMAAWFRANDASPSERVHRGDVVFVSADILERLDDIDVEDRFVALFSRA